MSRVLINLNKCMFVGRIATDIKMKDMGDGTKVINFLLAVNRRHKSKASGKNIKDTAYLEMEAWSTGAEAIYNCFQRDEYIFVEASAKTMWIEQETDNKSLRKTKFRIDRFEPIINYDDYEGEDDKE